MFWFANIQLVVKAEEFGMETEFKIDLSQGFPHLSRAPIVEAVISITATGERPWDLARMVAELKGSLSGYPESMPQKEFQSELRMDSNAAPRAAVRDLGWKGMCYRSEDRHNLVTFGREGFQFNRLRPYENWEKFSAEAIRLWKVFVRVTQPTEAQKVVVRFINNLELPPKELQFEEYIDPHPKPPRNLELPFRGFFQKDVLVVPGTPYLISVVRTIQGLPFERLGLIIDIDVTREQSFQLKDLTEIERYLLEMRWLKNRAFFGSVTERVLKAYA